MFCTYFSDRKYNLRQHINNKHSENIETNNIEKNCENVTPCGENVTPRGENVTPCGENVTPRGENVTPDFFCKKCKKKYSSKRYLINHEYMCKGIDDLTCPKCMMSFSNRHHKSRHIKRNNCKARSIIHARETNVEKIIQNIIHTQNNIQTQNNITINNFGNERVDHISYEDILKMLMSGVNTIPKYIERKHFDKKFPENKNILYTRENKCMVLENDYWKEKDIGLLSSKLIKENANVLLLYCNDNDMKLSEEINDEEIYKHVKNKLIVIYNKTNNEKYNYVSSSIKDLIKNAKNELNGVCIDVV